MANSSGEKVITPRNFYLLEELEKSEKGQTDMSVSYGLMRSDDIFLQDWLCTILGPPNSPVYERIISVQCVCGPAYPDQPPTMRFQSKVNFPFVGPTGELVANKLPSSLLTNWKRGNTIQDLLLELRRCMTRPDYKKLSQPADGSTYN